MTFNKWEFRDDVLISEVLERNLDYRQLLEILRNPVLGFYSLAFMIGKTEYDILGIKKRVDFVAGSLYFDNQILDDVMDTDIDLLWHWYYDKEVDVTNVGVHYWKDRFPYVFRRSNYYSGQSKLMMDALESVLSEKPRHVYIVGSASDTWRAGLASELLYRYMDVSVTAYDVFEVGGTYSNGSAKLDFVPMGVDMLNIPDCDLLIDDRWPIQTNISALKYSRKNLTKIKCKQPFFKAELEHESRDRSFTNHYEEYCPLTCNCYECAYFHNMMNFFSVPDKKAIILQEIIFTEAGHFPFHNSECYLEFLIGIYIRRNRIDTFSSLCAQGFFDQSDLDKVFGRKIGFKPAESFSIIDGMIVLRDYSINYKNNDDVVCNFGPNESGYDTRVSRFTEVVTNNGPGANIFNLFVKCKVDMPTSRFKIDYVSIREYNDRIDSVMIQNRNQMAGVVVFDESFKYVESGSGGKCFSLPKGHINVGETSFDAAVREFNEEVGYVLCGKFIRCDHFQVAYNNYQYDYDLYTYVTDMRLHKSILIEDLVLEQQRMVSSILIRIINNQKIDDRFSDFINVMEGDNQINNTKPKQKRKKQKQTVKIKNQNRNLGIKSY